MGTMEGEVQEIQMELAALRRDRLELHNRKLFLDGDDISSALDGPLKYKDERPQMNQLHEGLISARNIADEERLQREKYEAKLLDLELKLNSICSPGGVAEVKEPRKNTSDEEMILKNQIRDMKEEVDEMKMTLDEKSEELQEYRAKYLQAQQQVEEMKKQMDVIEFDNKQVSDQIQIEIQKMKMQFQEKLQDLAPLPDLLKGAQIQLQEAKQLQKLAEDSSQQLSDELHRVKEKLVTAVNNLAQEKSERAKLVDENKRIRIFVDDKQKEIDELTKNLDEYKCHTLRLEERLTQQEKRLKEKATECSRMTKDLEDLRSESSRSISRNKERSDSMRRYMQTQISELERQLIQSRAQGRSCQKERDEIRRRMQIQINNLQENFEMVEMRLRSLQNQIASLKNSYPVILADDDSELKII